MITIKRTPAQVNDRIKTWMNETHKYKNQMNFTGIKQDDNIYAIDQDSFRDSQNVYVDDNQRLVSRPSLQTEKLPDNVLSGAGMALIWNSPVPSTYRLIDIKDFGSGKLYISQSTLLTTPKYTIVLLKNGGNPSYQYSPYRTQGSYYIEGVTKYHISIIEQYIICFNDVNAKIFDTNDYEKGWQNLTDFAEIPVVKRITAGSVTEYDKNYFIPNLYKNEYIWSAESQPTLPSGFANEVIANTKYGQINITNQHKYLSDVLTKGMSNVNIDTEYRLLTPAGLNLPYDTLKNAYISSGKQTICIAFEDCFYYSPNNGQTFEKVFYPAYSGTFLKIAEVSKDGNYFFFVTTFGVYRCELGSLTWSNVFRRNNNGSSDNLIGNRDVCDNYSNVNWAGYRSYFLTGDIFCFELYDSQHIYLYYKGPGLYAGNTSTSYQDDHMDSTQPDYYRIEYITTAIDNQSNEVELSSICDLTDDAQPAMAQSLDFNIQLFTNSQGKEVACIFGIYQSANSDTQNKLLSVTGGDNSAITSSYKMRATINSLFGVAPTINDEHTLTSSVIKSATLYSVDGGHIEFTLEVMGVAKDRWYNDGTYTEETNITIATMQVLPLFFTVGYSTTGYTVLPSAIFSRHYRYYLPLPLGSNNLLCYPQTWSMTYGNIDYIPIYNMTTQTAQNAAIVGTGIATVSGNTYYVINSKSAYNSYSLWTNYMYSNVSYQIDYTIGTADNFTKVPNVSYADTDLYLAFDNLLQITYNSSDPEDVTKTLFNLPAINNQSFIDNITGLINISTTEVAIFFENKITICSKVEDSNLAQGFRYDYYNTKLSTGIRLGDSVINTLEGSFTLFPTLRGLAAMNYQAFMATTDQVITYLTDIVKEMWTEFFYESKEIHLIQWRSRLVITNDTGTILIYDLEKQAWWRWKVPANTNKALTDQTLLRIIEDNNGDINGNTLKIFKLLTDAYYDYSEDGDFTHPIEWFALSQPIHFNAPNHYKNIKQLVFQMQDSDGTNGKKQKTMDAQVRLYRKKITTREPETVAFTIDGYRTFVKRFNYWKINELQWCLSQDEHTATPFRLELDGLSVKYELGEEVR